MNDIVEIKKKLFKTYRCSGYGSSSLEDISKIKSRKLGGSGTGTNELFRFERDLILCHNIEPIHEKDKLPDRWRKGREQADKSAAARRYGHKSATAY